LARTDSQEGDATAKTELTHSTTGGISRAKPALGTLKLRIVQVIDNFSVSGTVHLAQPGCDRFRVKS